MTNNRNADVKPPPCPTCKALRAWLEKERVRAEEEYRDEYDGALVSVLAKLDELEAEHGDA